MKYAYRCPRCGEIESTLCEQQVQCRCGEQARRLFQVRFDRSSLRQSGRWDPVVGTYVANDREFRNELARGAEAQAEKLGMDVNLVSVDARDHGALDELHGRSSDQREADLEPTRKAEYERANA